MWVQIQGIYKYPDGSMQANSNFLLLQTFLYLSVIFVISCAFSPFLLNFSPPHCPFLYCPEAFESPQSPFKRYLQAYECNKVNADCTLIEISQLNVLYIETTKNAAVNSWTLWYWSFNCTIQCCKAKIPGLSKNRLRLYCIITINQSWASVLFKRTFRSLRSCLFFIKGCSDLCVLFRSL